MYRTQRSSAGASSARSPAVTRARAAQQECPVLGQAPARQVPLQQHQVSALAQYAHHPGDSGT